MNEKTNVASICQSEKSDQQKVLQKYLKMSRMKLARLLIIEENAKNRAYQILKEENLAHMLQNVLTGNAQCG